MNTKQTLALCAIILCGVASAVAQKNRPKVKFGDVKPEDFAPAAYRVDSTANAVYLYESGKSAFVGNNQGYVSIEHKTHIRIRIMNKNAFDVATVVMNIYGNNSDGQKLEQLDAATYNLVNGQVVATKLDKGSIFKEKDGNYLKHKFTFPNIKEGSIIEYAYQITTPGYQIPTWYYQGDYPRLWSEYEVTIPALYDFAFVKQGYHPYSIDTAIASYGSLYIIDQGSAGSASQSYTWSGNTVNSIWAMENVPTLKREAFTTTLRNYVAKIEFQLCTIRYPERPPKQILRNWFDVAADMLKDEDFGAGLAERNGWIDDEVQKMATAGEGAVERAKKIYRYVRDNFTCTGAEAIWLSQPLKKTFQSKKGNVADLNLLLTAFYINQGYDAHPVLLSTRDHGRAIESYPIMSKFNYVLCRLQVDSVYYNLDASQTNLGFGKLPVDCYNGTGRTIDKMPYLVNYAADSLKEKSSTSVFIVKDEKGGLVGSVTNSMGYFESARLRNKLKKTKQEDFFKDLKKGYSYDVDISNSGIDSLQLLDEPVDCHYDIKFDFKDEQLVYFNPIIGMEVQKDNPFKAAERFYPVEMPYCMDESYVLNMEIPKGYKVEELPKSTRVNLNETEGKFEYIIAASKDLVQMRTRVMLNKARFEPEDYQTLRDFFTYVVKKQSEQIVFKKIDQ
jgi:hypothetical protein